MKYIIGCFLLMHSFIPVIGQTQSSQKEVVDTLSEIVVKSFQFNGKWLQVPASVSLINNEQLQIKSTPNLLPSINAIAGVRMEERSPLSYRLSIRGSVIRSPFGVRNIKMYWNDLPISDGGGNTYFNLIDATQIHQIEIIKGAAASMYGAGTTGVVLLQTKINDTAKNAFTAQINGGSFSQLQQQFSWSYKRKKWAGIVTQSHQQSQGYREHSASRKDNITWLTNFQHNRHQFQSMVWYTNLFYQTPGGLTQAQWVLNPKLSRPATSTLPSAITQKAAIYNSTLFVGLQHQLSISQFHRTHLSFVASQSTIKNPFITNYETRNEWNIGVHGKSVFQKKVQQINLQWINGFELLQNFSTIANFGNRRGEKDTLQLRDKVKALQSYVYSQLQLSHSLLHVTLGLSINQQQLKYKRVSSGVNNYVTQKTPVQAMPRLAVALLITPSLTLYSSIAKGFSPPSLAEVRPSDGNFYTQLTGENGFNTEIGIKGSIGEKRFQFDLTVYRFVLNDAIVRRNTNSGTEYFINAGSIRQEGIEWFSKWLLFNHPKGLLQQVSLTTSVSYQPYQFINYQQGNANFSGNKVTGVPMYNVVNTCFIQFKNALYTEISHQYVHKTPLNDANDMYASDYRLVQIRAGYLLKQHQKQYRLFIGVDNLLNENYSLGNDINAVGRRYFNAAPTINFFGGIKMAW